MMPVNRTFTEGADRYDVTVNDSFFLNYRGGDDTMVTRAGTTTAYLGAGNDIAWLIGGAANVYGEAGADRFEIYISNARVDGGADNDMFVMRGGYSHVLLGGAGDDRFYFVAGATNETLYGGDGNDYFSGAAHSVTGNLFGEAGNDIFVGFSGAGANLYGGAGNDVYRVDPAASARFIEYAGQGTDTIEVAVGRNYTLPTNFENLAVRNFAVFADPATLTGNAANNRIEGSSAIEEITGLAGDDSLFGFGGVDYLNGGDGNDRINGGRDGDLITTGAGEDVIVYSSVADSPYSMTYADYDWILDWNPIDHIDLSAIDANSTIAGNQQFRFAGYAFGFPGTDHSAGSVTIAGFGGELYIIGYVNNDDIPDLIISLWSDIGESGLTVDNLIL